MSETPTTPQEETLDKQLDEALAIANEPSVAQRVQDAQYMRNATELSRDIVFPDATLGQPELSRGKKITRTAVGVTVAVAASAGIGAVVAPAAADMFIEDQENRVEENQRLSQEQEDFQRQLDNGAVVIDVKDSENK